MLLKGAAQDIGCYDVKLRNNIANGAFELAM
jgi:hypothetical protein